MKPLIMLAPIMLLLFATCSKNIASTNAFTDGTYAGTFTRTSPNARYASAKVSITLKNGSFTGTSDIVNYPAICSGTFKMTGKNITVENECMFSANFDWSLIFKGTYQYELENGELKIYRRNSNDIIDQYNLKKQ
jgi:major membrane immunogen (membrane-anchored lipoprotein)